ncbi:hypothetical protein B0H13DRAFT_2329255 [Mycena leptocephala]|nr:hypothetical protein B0H13DRAFT_2329255 [Mycena leptocephala]
MQKESRKKMEGSEKLLGPFVHLLESVSHSSSPRKSPSIGTNDQSNETLPLSSSTALARSAREGSIEDAKAAFRSQETPASNSNASRYARTRETDESAASRSRENEENKQGSFAGTQAQKNSTSSPLFSQNNRKKKPTHTYPSITTRRSTTVWPNLYLRNRLALVDRWCLRSSCSLYSRCSLDSLHLRFFCTPAENVKAPGIEVELAFEEVDVDIEVADPSPEQQPPASPLPHPMCPAGDVRLPRALCDDDLDTLAGVDAEEGRTLVTRGERRKGEEGRKGYREKRNNDEETKTHL